LAGPALRQALVRACDVHDVPCATKLSSARALLAHQLLSP